MRKTYIQPKTQQKKTMGKSIIEIFSKNPWKTTTIMVWVHGNETAWIHALQEILHDIEIIAWKIYLIFANIEAITAWKRFFEKNLNRCFIKDNTSKTYEDKRAKEIISFLEESDFLLDIHNTLNSLNSIPFLISEHKELAKFFDVNLIVSWFDTLHPWGSDGFMNTIGKKWLCLESWSIYDKNSVFIAKKSIINFLKFTWNISWDPETMEKQKFIKFDKIYKNKTLNFKFKKKFLDFEKIKKWGIIAYDWWKKIISDRNWIILFTYDPKKIWDECFCLGKYTNE